jgi:hypothetical protein
VCEKRSAASIMLAERATELPKKTKKQKNKNKTNECTLSHTHKRKGTHGRAPLVERLRLAAPEMTESTMASAVMPMQIVATCQNRGKVVSLVGSAFIAFRFCQSKLIGSKLLALP